MDLVEINKTDLGTLLDILSSRIRNDGLAVAGLAYRHADPGTAEHRDLLAVTERLEKTAAIIKAVSEQLCRECRLQDVVESVRFGKASFNLFKKIL